MPKPKQQGTNEFNFRAGAGGFPGWKGINLSSDPTTQDKNQLSDGINIRPLAGGYSERGGQTSLVTVSGAILGIYDPTVGIGSPSPPGPPSSSYSGATPCQAITSAYGSGGERAYVWGIGCGGDAGQPSLPGGVYNYAPDQNETTQCMTMPSTWVLAFGGTTYAPGPRVGIHGSWLGSGGIGYFILGKGGTSGFSEVIITKWFKQPTTMPVFPQPWKMVPIPATWSQSPTFSPSSQMLGSPMGYRDGVGMTIVEWLNAAASPSNYVIYLFDSNGNEIATDSGTVGGTAGANPTSDGAQYREDFYVYISRTSVLFIRKYELSSDTWSSLTFPVDVTSFQSSCTPVVYKDKLYFFGTGVLASKPGKFGLLILSYDGASMAVAHEAVSVAGSPGAVRWALVGGDNVLYYDVNQTTPTLGSYDGTTWNDANLDFTTKITGAVNVRAMRRFRDGYVFLVDNSTLRKIVTCSGTTPSSATYTSVFTPNTINAYLTSECMMVL